MTQENSQHSIDNYIVLKTYKRDFSEQCFSFNLTYKYTHALSFGFKQYCQLFNSLKRYNFLPQKYLFIIFVVICDLLLRQVTRSVQTNPEKCTLPD